MSSFTLLVSDSPLTEVDHSGIVRITVRELKKLYPINENTPEEPWHSMDDDARILHAPDQSAFGQLAISVCTNPPYDLDFYSEKEYLYWVSGSWEGKFLTDFADYLKEYIKAEENVQLLIFWAGDGEQELVEQTVRIDEIEPTQLELFKREDNLRLHFV
ncbi:hypothetical protein [Sporosarcina highlanderae]|uniref:Uncharacterized protein n=1 Tax=Sporosarcina highlanderae TaxID=3035916 RepID=A0ABT8JM53_9BACL|nr:hypothetical protein [Sporosarcina highlanderae]MDN4606230.1 hypothetical protein [Sporosarcina highlanderae]